MARTEEDVLVCICVEGMSGEVEEELRRTNTFVVVCMASVDLGWVVVAGKNGNKE